MRVRAFLVGCLALLSACSSGPEQKVVKVDGTVVFRLGARPDGFELRLESAFYPTSGYELVTRLEGVSKEGTIDDLAAGLTVVLEGVRVPFEPAGPRAPASATLELKTKQAQPIDGATFPLCFKIPAGDGSGQLDPYTLQHTAKGWRLSRTQGGFSRFEAQGSF